MNMNAVELEGIPTLRVKSQELILIYRRDPDTNKLYVGNKEIAAIVYYQTFYNPENFTDPEMWTLRSEMEQSSTHPRQYEIVPDVVIEPGVPS